ncbi:MAG TPA: GNAT family N-acetyltransferase, partial [Gemmatimonadales bacterium]|nr:GNAT family N-acetyltransferase [Gemmatimonadales bacterium]
GCAAMKLSIRQATPADAAAIAAVEITTWQTAYRHLMPDAFLDGFSVEEQTANWSRSLVKHQNGRRKRTVVAVCEDEVAGFATIGRAQDETDEGLVYLVYVLPEHWGRGVGKALMAAAADALRELGVREATLWVLRENQRARHFYESLGWQPDGRTRIDDYGGVELEAVCYRRTIPGQSRTRRN